MAIYKAMRSWMKVNGDSIYETVKTTLPKQGWGESTSKDDVLYLHVFDWPTTGEFVFGGLTSPIRKAYLLSDPEQRPLSVDLLGKGIHSIHVPSMAPDAIASVIAVECEGGISTSPERLLLSEGTDELHAFDAQLSGTRHLGRSMTIRYGAGHEKMNYVYNWKGEH